jgi:Family of unknown function (DUF6166)
MRIEGDRDDYGRLLVRVDGEVLTPGRSHAVWNHSPDGFECGYAGSGPAQLALAILLAAGLPDERAGRLHQRFKFAHVQHWQTPFDVTIDVLDWVTCSTGDSDARDLGAGR